MTNNSRRDSGTPETMSASLNTLTSIFVDGIPLNSQVILDRLAQMDVTSRMSTVLHLRNLRLCSQDSHALEFLLESIKEAKSHEIAACFQFAQDMKLTDKPFLEWYHLMARVIHIKPENLQESTQHLQILCDGLRTGHHYLFDFYFELAPEVRQTVVTAYRISHLPSKYLDVFERRALLKALSETPDSEVMLTCAQQTCKTMEIPGSDLELIYKTILAINPDDRHTIVDLALRLPLEGCTSEHWSSSVAALAGIGNVSSCESIVDATIAAATPNSPWPELPSLFASLEEVAPHERISVAKYAFKLLDMLDIPRPHAEIIRELAKLSLLNQEHLTELVWDWHLFLGPRSMPWDLVLILAQMPVPEREEFGHHLWRVSGLLGRHFRSRFMTLATFQGDRNALVDFIEPILRLAQSSTDFEPLTQIPVGDREDMSEACALMLPEVRRDDRNLAINDLLAVPAGRRLARVQELFRIGRLGRWQVFHVADPPDQNVHNNQNVHNQNVNNAQTVHNSVWIEAISRATKSLIESGPLIANIDRNKVLDELEHYLNGLTQSEDPHERETVLRFDGHATAIDNALGVVSGDHRERHRNQNLRTNEPYDLIDGQIGLGDLTALVWKSIENYHDQSKSMQELENDRANMRYGVFSALAQCVDDRGRRVCGVGFTSRLLRALQGYFPSVRIDDENSKATRAQIMTLAGYRLQREFPLGEDEPEIELIRRFYDDVMEETEHIHAKNTDVYNDVEQDLNELLRLTFDSWDAFQTNRQQDGPGE
ncbi:hypothetical protein K461DRAFT_297596 [Myriangium duriaei CBS 260.36]|uniref:Uncharacterized protein n=1 Tax=Myriangium duriaei CBS 260.36 TaxID=1168546 RepID=A0A9P4IYF9_9PEZI|nr:hypothetical protein K461DRAFT_297596 [Myriangium duriaei CBS 260.36]